MKKVPGGLSLTKPPDGGYGWVVVVSTCMVSFLVLGIGYSIGVIFDVLLIDFGCSKAELTTFASIAYSLQCLLAPLASCVQHGCSARFTVIFGTLFFGLALVLSAFAPTVGILHLTFGALAGIGMGLVYLPTRAIIPTYFHKRRSVANALCSMGGYFGAFLFPIVIRFFTSVYSWRGALFIMGAIQFNALPAALLLLPVEQMVRSRVKRREEDSKADEDSDLNIEKTADDEQEAKISKRNREILHGFADKTSMTSRRDDDLYRKVFSGKTNAKFANPCSSMTLEPNITRSEYGRPTSDFLIPTKSGPNITHSQYGRPKSEHLNIPASPPSSAYPSLLCYHSGETGHISSVDNLQGNLVTLYQASMLEESENVINPNSIVDGSENKQAFQEKESKQAPLSAARGFFWHYFKHFRSPTFVAIFFGNFFKGFVYYVTALFIVNYGLSIGLSVEQTTMLMSMIGIGHFIGRPIAAFFGDLFSGHRMLLFALSHGFAGVVTLLVPWITNVYFLSFFVIQFSFMTGGADVLLAPIIADIVPLHELVFALGVVMASEGVAYFVGPLVLALLPTFFLIFTVVGVIMLFNAVIVILPDAVKLILNKTKTNTLVRNS